MARVARLDFLTTETGSITNPNATLVCCQAKVLNQIKNYEDLSKSFVKQAQPFSKSRIVF